jgi:predicted nucleic acid-binding protein
MTLPKDAWIAATALYLNAPLVTHNAAHFRDVPGLHVITEPDV